jgi:hypothetical protein
MKTRIGFIGAFAVLAMESVHSAECVDLAWQVPAKYMAFDTIMEEAAHDSKFSMSFEQFLDDEEASDKAAKLFEDFEFPKTTSMTAVLTPGKDGSIVVRMIMGKAQFDSPPASEQAAQIQKLMESMSGTVQLRGEMDSRGKLVSFYTPQRQKNLLSIFFELPGQCVAIGDEWSLSLNLLEMDQNFIADNATRHNTVRLVDIEERGGAKVAVLDYFVLESVSGTFTIPMQDKAIPTETSMTFTGRGYFNITEGRWQQLVGTLIMESSGVMTARSTQLLALRPATSVSDEILNAK